MQKKSLFVGLVLLLSASTSLPAQYYAAEDDIQKCFVGSSLFVLGNLDRTNPPDFVQLNLGYRLTGRDVLSLELKTWKYGWSLGIPYGESFESPEEQFPGFIRERGLAAAYQRYWWKGLYTGVHVMSAWQIFIGEDGQKLDDGFQVFNTYRLGYHVKLFGDRCFLQPSLAITHRPYHTEMPAAFKALDDRWPKLFYGEPGLHFGVNF